MLRENRLWRDAPRLAEVVHAAANADGVVQRRGGAVVAELLKVRLLHLLVDGAQRARLVLRRRQADALPGELLVKVLRVRLIVYLRTEGRRDLKNKKQKEKTV